MGQLNIAAKRVLSIDVFRGITILTMVFVNELAGIANVPGWMKHLAADVDGMTFVDLVFPAFLFIVGMSIPFASAARLKKGDDLRQLLFHVLIRSLSLIIIGVFMVNTIAGFDEQAMLIPMDLWTLLMYGAVLLVWCQYPRGWSKVASNIPKIIGGALLVLLWFLYEGNQNQGMTTQWWGILGLIGWAYLLASIVYLFALTITNAVSHILFLIVAALGFLGLFFLLDGVQEFQGSALQLLVNNNNNHTHAAIVLAGVTLSTLFYNEVLAASLKRNALLFIVASGALAFACWQVSPISKIWATPSWGLFSIFFCALIFTATYYIVDIKHYTRWCQFFAPAAANPLLVYLIPYVLIAAVGLAGVSYRPAFFDSGLAGIVWAAVFSIAIMWIGAFVSKMGVKLKL
ncbi:DUF5009 domain-containing protein [Gilvimarinus sp. SDUM040013]|uniref:DUF5009 domain-containing protein n=1 Tax=Gilvimarinus gilvus TaxID=3058038 RepID=A0ABU4RUE1_9GAMM|nr:DUF5009 domain-containing protein [Gilvimarinus sp. SDUM040013]MDO3388222.1 DUF5009 domain-containing protein [Gilvimarinus sp. SDUM040013]MDX6847772.1 DUF5009 domain-containing protein [Gilvimarinus sp. SDUM040013]